jgi:O-antigen ligase
MVWRSAFATFFAHPLVGQGLGTPVASHRFVTLSGQEQHLRDAHNVWLNLAGQGGILTLAAFAALVASIARRCVAHWGRSEPTAVVQTGLGLSLLGAFVYHGLTGSFEDARHLWVLAGLVVAIHQGLEPEPRVPRWA